MDPAHQKRKVRRLAELPLTKKMVADVEAIMDEYIRLATGGKVKKRKSTTATPDRLLDEKRKPARKSTDDGTARFSDELRRFQIRLESGKVSPVELRRFVDRLVPTPKPRIVIHGADRLARSVLQAYLENKRALDDW